MHSHRGCTRIVMLVASGPIEPGGEPLPDRVVSSGSPVRARLAALAFRQPSSANLRRRLVPSGGWRCSGELCRPAWRFQGRFEALSSGRLPLRAAFPSVAGLIIRSALPWPCGRRVRLPFAHSRPHSDLPIAARLSLHLRFARLCRETSPSVFSDAAAGIAAIPIGFEFPLPFQAVRPEREIGRAHV